MIRPRPGVVFPGYPSRPVMFYAEHDSCWRQTTYEAFIGFILGFGVWVFLQNSRVPVKDKYHDWITRDSMFTR